MNSERLQQTEISELEKSTGRLLWVVPLASLAAIIVNVIFYFIVTQWFNEPLLMLDQFPPPTVVPMGVDEVILFSLIWSLAAGLVYAFLTAVTAKPERLFIIISAVVLLVSFALPLKMPTPPIAMSAKFSLMMMHIIGGVVVVGLLVTLGRKGR
jgi:hypothetical protein